MKNNIRLFKSAIDNPFTRFFLSKFGYCKTYYENILEVALDLYIGSRKNACKKCKLAENFLSQLITSSGKFFGVKQEDLKNRFKDLYWKKGLANVISGIATFGVEKPFVPGAPFLIVWDITKKCNLSCKHCYANAGEEDQEQISTSQAKNIIDRLSKNSVPIISFSGGEPLVRDDIFELTKYAAEKGIYVGLATNGTLITKQKAQQMKNASINFVQISLDGATAETHDSFRGVNGMFEKTVQGIKNCVDQEFFVNVATVATKHNISEIPDTISLCDDLSVKWFMMYNFVPVGRGESIITTDLTPDQREKLLTNLYKGLRDDNVNVDLLSTAPQFARVA